jgi:hypothetical protein
MRDTIDMAREAGIDDPESDWMFWNAMERFAALVRADAIAGEREACAKVCESFQQDPYEELLYKSDFAAAIRARSKA